MSKKVFDEIIFIILNLIIFIVILPFVILLLMSFSGGWKWPEVFPHTFNLRAWKYVLFETSGTIKAVKTSLQIALTVCSINLFLAIPAGNALGRYDFRGKKAIQIVLIMPIIIPPIVVMMGMYKSFIRLGLTESILGVVIAHIIPTLPYMIRAVTVSYRNLGFRWEEQAKMLGSNRINRFVHVTLPFLLPGIIAGCSLTILISLSQYIITMLIGGGQISTLPIIMFPYINGGDESIGAVYSVIFAFVAFVTLRILDFFLNKYYR